MPAKRRSDTSNEYDLRSKIKKDELLGSVVRLRRSDRIKRIEIDVLPSEIFGKIFSKLDLLDIANATLVCRKWNELSKLAKVAFTVTKDSDVGKILHPDERSESKVAKEKYDESDVLKLKASAKFSQLVYKVDLSNCGLEVFRLTKNFPNLKTLRIESFKLETSEETIEFWSIMRSFEETLKHLYFDDFTGYNLCHGGDVAAPSEDVMRGMERFPTCSYRVNYRTKVRQVVLSNEETKETLKMDLPYDDADGLLAAGFAQCRNLTKLSITSKVPFDF